MYEPSDTLQRRVDALVHRIGNYHTSDITPQRMSLEPVTQR